MIRKSKLYNNLIYEIHEIKEIGQNKKVYFDTRHDFKSNYIHYKFYEFNIFIHGHDIVRYKCFSSSIRTEYTFLLLRFIIVISSIISRIKFSTLVEK